MNVLKEICQSYHSLELEEGEVYDEDNVESSYSFIVFEIIESSYDSKWYRESYPEQCAWAKDNNLAVIEQDGGGEGGGEYCYMIFSWKDKTYKIEYSYYSYNGHDFDGVEDTIREVVPVEKLVTVYEDKK